MKNREINELLANENSHMEKLHKIVEDAIAAEDLIVKKLLHPPAEQLSVGQKISDKVHDLAGAGDLLSFFRLFWLYGYYSMHLLSGNGDLFRSLLS
jgi:hypothetical protein